MRPKSAPSNVGPVAHTHRDRTVKRALKAPLSAPRDAFRNPRPSYSGVCWLARCRSCQDLVATSSTNRRRDVPKDYDFTVRASGLSDCICVFVVLSVPRKGAIVSILTDRHCKEMQHLGPSARRGEIGVRGCAGRNDKRGARRGSRPLHRRPFHSLGLLRSRDPGRRRGRRRVRHRVRRRPCSHVRRHCHGGKAGERRGRHRRTRGADCRRRHARRPTPRHSGTTGVAGSGRSRGGRRVRDRQAQTGRRRGYY